MSHIKEAGAAKDGNAVDILKNPIIVANADHANKLLTQNNEFDQTADDLTVDHKPVKEDSDFKAFAKRSLMARGFIDELDNLYSNDLEINAKTNDAITSKSVESKGNRISTTAISDEAESIEDYDDDNANDDYDDEDEDYDEDNLDDIDFENTSKSHQIQDQPRGATKQNTVNQLKRLPAKSQIKRRYRFRIRLPNLYGNYRRKPQQIRPKNRLMAVLQKINKRLQVENQREHI